MVSQTDTSDAVSWMGSSSKQRKYLEEPQCLHFSGEIIQPMAYL